MTADPDHSDRLARLTQVVPLALGADVDVESWLEQRMPLCEGLSPREWASDPVRGEQLIRELWAVAAGN